MDKITHMDHIDRADRAPDDFKIDSFKTIMPPVSNTQRASESVFTDDGGRKLNAFTRFLRKLALPSADVLKRFNWRSVKAQFDLLDNYDECQKDIYMVESDEIDPVDCPYRIDSFLGEIPSNGFGWSGVPSEVHSLYTNPMPGERRTTSLKKKRSLGIVPENMTDEELHQLLEDLFHDIPNEEIAWARLPTDLEVVLEEALHHKWKDIDFAPELPKINNLLRKKLNKQMKYEDRRSDWEDILTEDESISSCDEVEVVENPPDGLDGLSEDDLSNEDANWSDIEDYPEDKQFKEDDPTFFTELEELFSSKYRGDNDNDKDFIEISSDTSSIFGEIPAQDYTSVTNALDKIFQDLPDFIEVVWDHPVAGIFDESNFNNDEEDIEATSDLEELFGFGDDSQEELEIHSDQSSLYGTDSSDEEENEVQQDYFSLQNSKTRRVIQIVSDDNSISTKVNKVKVHPPLELTDMELIDLIKLRFLKQKGRSVDFTGNSLTPLENEIDCLVQLAAEIRGYGKSQDLDEDSADDVNVPKTEVPSYAWANVSHQKEDNVKQKGGNSLDKIDIVPSFYSLRLNFPKNTKVHPFVLKDVTNRFHEPKTLKEYQLSKGSIDKLKKIKATIRSTKNRNLIFAINCGKLRKHFFHKTSLGKAFRKNMRYYRETAHFPRFCRRCHVQLEESIIPEVTPIASSFCCLLPFFSLPCYYANKEYRCYVCQEIYTLGDFRPPAEPTYEEKEAKRIRDEQIEQKRITRRRYSNLKYS